MEARKTAIRFAVSKDIFLPLFNLLLTNFSIQLVKYHRVVGQMWLLITETMSRRHLVITISRSIYFSFLNSQNSYIPINKIFPCNSKLLNL